MASTFPIVQGMDQDEVEYARTPWWRLFLQRKFRLKSRTAMPKDGEPEGGKQEEPARGFWANEAESVLSLLGLAVGLGNIWRFPWMVSRNGGGAFLIPYFLMLFLCGIPLFLMELTIGQYSGSGPGNVFEAAPIFKGIGWCVLANAIVVGAYYITIIAWSFYYLFSSFTSHLPWSDCTNDWNSRNCYTKSKEDPCELAQNNSIFVGHMCRDNNTLNRDIYQHQESSRVAPTDEFFNRKMYSIFTSDGTQRTMYNTGTLKWDITLTVLFVWIVTYLCICKGIKSSGKVVYFTALFPYVAITALLIVAAQLDGAGDGVEYYLRPPANASVFFNHTIWVDATTQIFYSLGLSGGSVMTYASYNRYNNNILRDCLIVGLGNSLTSFFAGFPVFCILGYMAKRLGTDIQDVVKSGSALVFIVYPEVLSTLTAAPLWCCIFFLMLISLGLDSQFGILETLLTATLDKRPKLIPKKPLVALVLCVCMFLFGLSTVCQAGVYWEELLNYYSGFSSVVLAFVNSIIYGWVYGASKLIDHLQHMINKKFPVTVVWILLFFWKIVAPFTILIIFIFNFINVRKIDYHGYELPDWAQAFGWLVVLVPLLLVPIAAMLTLRQDMSDNRFSAETVLQRLKRLTQPSELWKPSYLKHEQTIANISPALAAATNGNLRPDAASTPPLYGSNDNSIDLTDITRQNSIGETTEQV